MAQTAPKRKPSVLKRARQNVKRRLRNKSEKSKVKTLIKTYLDALDSKEVPTIEQSLKDVIRALSKLSSKGIMHRNTVSRKISRLAIKANEFLNSKAA
ncbi:MAG: 30S ribosomal protein S20 [Candidatus Magnetoovum sp. WYHC-5]|nr:30S ribosomal protein S20 [Candidatus Magnetoovum sp. WYHC-5]